MYKSLVLKHVAEPSRVLFASIEGTVISVSLWFVLTIAVVLVFPPMVSLVVSLVVLMFNQSAMAFLTYKDPYFINVLMARLKCRKTKNLIPTKNNRYGD